MASLWLSWRWSIVYYCDCWNIVTSLVRSSAWAYSARLQYLRFKKRFRNLLLIVAAAGLIGDSGARRWYSRIDTIESADQDYFSFMGRIEAWRMSTVIALDRPLTGIGFRTMEVSNVWISYFRNFSFFFPSTKKTRTSRERMRRIASFFRFWGISDLSV